MNRKIRTKYALTTATQPRANITEWKYKIENGKLYKRLYNLSQECWVGNWVYVCDI